jgi:hypothetical protein
MQTCRCIVGTVLNQLTVVSVSDMSTLNQQTRRNIGLQWLIFAKKPADKVGRYVLAIGNIIIKSGHIHPQRSVQFTHIHYSYADGRQVRSHVVPDSKVRANGRIQPL